MPTTAAPARPRPPLDDADAGPRRRRRRRRGTGRSAREAARRQSSPRDPPRRDRSGRGTVRHRRARAHQRDQGLRHLLGQVQLHRVRRRHRRRQRPRRTTRSIERSSTRSSALPPGRMLWEPSSDIGRYGTPLALMMLPYWTDGRISSMEGLYYESSATTPYHFLAAATLTSTPSNAVRGLPYRNSTDFDARRAVPPTARASATTRRCPTCSSWRRPTRRCARSPPCPTSTSARRSAGRSTRWPTRPSSSPLRYEPVVARDLHADDELEVRGRSPSPRPARPASPSWARGSAWPCPGSTIPPRSTGRSPTTGPTSWQRVGDARCPPSGEKGRFPT